MFRWCGGPLGVGLIYVGVIPLPTREVAFPLLPETLRENFLGICAGSLFFCVNSPRTHCRCRGNVWRVALLPKTLRWLSKWFFWGDGGVLERVNVL